MEFLTPFCIWDIWLGRNDNIFNHNQNPIPQSQSIEATTEFKLLIEDKLNAENQVITIQLKWEPPPEGINKLNIDGVVLGQSGIGGLGGFLELSIEVGLRVSSRNVFTQPLLPELQALLHGLSMTIERNFTSSN